MPEPESGRPEARAPLSRERVLRGALAIADAAGIGALTIRSLARELGVKPMSLYHYVASKDDILDGIVNLVFSEDRATVPRRRLAGGDAPASDLSPSRAEAPPLGHRAPAIASQPRRRDAATPRRDHRHPARGGLLGSYDRSRLRPARRLASTDSRSRRPRCPSNRRPSPTLPDRPASRSPPATTPASSRWRPSTSSSPATTSATSSRSAQRDPRRPHRVDPRQPRTPLPDAIELAATPAPRRHHADPRAAERSDPLTDHHQPHPAPPRRALSRRGRRYGLRLRRARPRIVERTPRLAYSEVLSEHPGSRFALVHAVQLAQGTMVPNSAAS